MHERILTYVNIVLILVCAGCIFYLVTEEYQKPAEVARMEAFLPKAKDARAETDIAAAPAMPVATPREDPTLPFYTPTPTPQPTPTPTPAPPPIFDLVASWKIINLDTGYVQLYDDRTEDKEPFTLRPGESHPSTWKDGKQYMVTVDSIDLNNFTVIFSFMGQTHNMSM